MLQILRNATKKPTKAFSGVVHFQKVQIWYYLCDLFPENVDIHNKVHL